MLMKSASVPGRKPLPEVNFLNLKKAKILFMIRKRDDRHQQFMDKFVQHFSREYEQCRSILRQNIFNNEDEQDDQRYNRFFSFINTLKQLEIIDKNSDKDIKEKDEFSYLFFNHISQKYKQMSNIYNQFEQQLTSTESKIYPKPQNQQIANSIINTFSNLNLKQIPLKQYETISIKLPYCTFLTFYDYNEDVQESQNQPVRQYKFEILRSKLKDIGNNFQPINLGFTVITIIPQIYRIKLDFGQDREFIKQIKATLTTYKLKMSLQNPQTMAIQIPRCNKYAIFLYEQLQGLQSSSSDGRYYRIELVYRPKDVNQ